MDALSPRPAGRIKRSWAPGVPLAAALFLLLAPAAALAQQTSVSAVDNAFDPAELEVDAGTTVTWTNDGDSPHTVTASDGSFDSGNLEPGDEYTVTFDDPGEFNYFCEYHGTADGEGMAGAVTVAAARGGGGGDGAGDGGDAGAGDGDDEALPQTGPEIGTFVYLGLVFIAAGFAFLRLERGSV